MLNWRGPIELRHTPIAVLGIAVGPTWPDTADSDNHCGMPFSVSAYVDDHRVSATTETAKEAFAKAVEWHVVDGFTNISISDGIKSYSIDALASAMAMQEIANTVAELKSKN